MPRDTLRLVCQAAQAANLSMPAFDALVMRLAYGRWPRELFTPAQYSDARAELRQASFLDQAGRPDLLALQAAAAVWRATRVDVGP